MAKTENRNPATWTDLDRRVIDTARRLEPEELDFVLQIMEVVNAQEQPRAAAMMRFAEAEASGYKLHTAEGRAAFMAAMQAV